MLRALIDRVRTVAESSGETFVESPVYSEFTYEPDTKIARNVAFLGSVSLDMDGNVRRTFSRDLKRAEAKQYARRKVYDNHDMEAIEGRRVRSNEDLVGETLDAWYDEARDQVRGDIRFFSTDKGLRIATLCQEAAHHIGCSPVHDLLVDKTTKATQRIRRVRSVDIVTDPATTTSLLESRADNASEFDMPELKDLTVEQLRALRPDLVQGLVAEATSAHEGTARAKALEERLSAAESKAKEAEEKLLASESRAVIEEVLGEAGAKKTLPKLSIDRIRRACEGKVVTREQIEKAVAEEADYLRALGETRKPSSVVGAGATDDEGGRTEAEAKRLAKSGREALRIVERVLFDGVFEDEYVAEDQAAEAALAAAGR